MRCGQGAGAQRGGVVVVEGVKVAILSLKDRPVCATCSVPLTDRHPRGRSGFAGVVLGGHRFALGFRSGDHRLDL